MNRNFYSKGEHLKLLLVEANDMPKWVGGDIPFEVHIPPVGLMYLAAYAQQAFPKLEIRIIESSLHCPTDDEYVNILREFQPDIVGIRSITFFLEELQRIAKLTRANRNSFIIVGGPIVQAYKGALFSYAPEIDIAVKGEGEHTFVKIISGEHLYKIDGILYPDAGGVVENTDVAVIADIDRIPFPAYGLIDLSLYERHLSYAYNHRRQGVLVTSRGCVYDCTFCFKHWDGIRLRSAENVYKEIEELYNRYDVRDFYVVDDIFNVSLRRALSLFKRITSGGLKLRLYFANGLRADIINEEFVDCAIDAGAIWFTYAIESASDEIQSLVNKRVNLEKARKIIEYTQRKGVVVNVSTMYGFPTETKEQAHQTLEWLGTLDKPSLLPYHFCLRCFPGCRITEQALEAGWDPGLLELSNRLSYNDLPIGTPTLPKAEMYKILLEYHNKYGLNNVRALREAVHTLKSVGYTDPEITHMYSVLKHRMINDVGELGKPCF
jgi:radical SAM superfamily enzyme YgiQ (UPF0313 family)